MRNAVSAFAVVVVLAASTPSIQGGGPLPYGLVVTVDWGPQTGPESLRQELESELIRALVAATCFRSVGAERSEETENDADLRLRLQIDGYLEETEFEYALSQSGAPGLDTDRLTVAHAEATLLAEVIDLRQGVVVRSRRFRKRASWRPTWHEDPREYAQRQLVEDVVQTTRKLVCQGSATKWSKQIDRARHSDDDDTQR